VASDESRRGSCRSDRALWSDSPMWLDGILVSYINISSLWRLVECEWRSVHVGICALVDQPGLGAMGLAWTVTCLVVLCLWTGVFRYVAVISWAGVSWHCHRLSCVWLSGRKTRVD
jgi:hypothetical protein